MKTMIYIGFVVGILLVGVGIFSIISPPPKVVDIIETNNLGVPHWVPGVLLVVYGSFRVFKSYKWLKRMNGQ